MSDEAPKVWKLEGTLAIDSGTELLQKLVELGVGDGVLAVGWEKFPVDDEGNIEADVPAEKVAKAFFKARYSGELTDAELKKGVVGTDYHVLDRHKDMVKQLCETGKYEWKPEKPFTLAERIKKLPKFSRKDVAVVAKGKKPE